MKAFTVSQCSNLIIINKTVLLKEKNILISSCRSITREMLKLNPAMVLEKYLNEIELEIYNKKSEINKE